MENTVEVNKEFVIDTYIAAEVGRIAGVEELPECCRHTVASIERKSDNFIDDILAMDIRKKINLVKCLSTQHRHNEVYMYLELYNNWRLKLVDIENLIIGGIVGLEGIAYNNRHKITDVIRHGNIPIGFDWPVETIEHFVFIGVADDIPLDGSDTSNNVRLIDGVHRVIQLAQAGETKFNICVGRA